jgi:hypothetical protein
MQPGFLQHRSGYGGRNGGPVINLRRLLEDEDHDWTQSRQGYALAALYFCATGSRWYTATSWLDPLVSEYDWFGISCDH